MISFKPSPYTRLGKQFVLIIAGMILLALFSNAFFQYFKERDRALQHLNQKGQVLGDLLRNISIESLLASNHEHIRELVKQTYTQHDVAYVVFRDQKGRLIAQHFNDRLDYIKQALSKTSQDDNVSPLDKLRGYNELMHLDFPVIHDSTHLATIEIGLDEHSLITAPLNNLYIQVTSSLMFGLMIGIGIYLGFVKKISNPVEQLRNSVRHISQLKFDTHIDINGNNELSELAKTIDGMRIALKQAEAERIQNLRLMERFNNSLEDRVRERTNELVKLNDQISYQAMHDPLTGLANRSLIIERLNQAIDYAARHNTRLAVFILDLNNFKDINDTLGHPEGDVILKQVADRLPPALRGNDTVGRLGGDEFAVILPDIDQPTAIEIARKIVRQLRPGFDLRSHIVDINASIGIALYPEHGSDHTSLIRHADVAMYEGKHHGQNICLYDPEFDVHTPSRLALMADLRQAIEEDRLELHFQPQFNLDDGSLYGVEALLRWEHDIRGFIPPDQFIYIAENSSLIQPLTLWVLNAAFKQWQQWKQTGLELELSINISARNFNNPKLADKLHDLIQQYDVNKKKIKLEFTESALMSTPAEVLRLMTTPKLQGLRYSIDDFGTGYSSLSYLKRLPVNEVKIDRSFIHQMDTNDDDASIVNSVIDLAHNLGHKVVAEGVETENVMQMLKSRGCDSVQGYLLSRPLNADKVQQLYNDQLLKKTGT